MYLRVKGFRDSRIQGSKDSGIQGFGDLGIWGFTDSGIQGAQGVLRDFKGFQGILRDFKRFYGILRDFKLLNLKKLFLMFLIFMVSINLFTSLYLTQLCTSFWLVLIQIMIQKLGMWSLKPVLDPPLLHADDDVIRILLHLPDGHLGEHPCGNSHHHQVTFITAVST